MKVASLFAESVYANRIRFSAWDKDCDEPEEFYLYPNDDGEVDKHTLSAFHQAIFNNCEIDGISAGVFGKTAGGQDMVEIHVDIRLTKYYYYTGKIVSARDDETQKYWKIYRIMSIVDEANHDRDFPVYDYEALRKFAFSTCDEIK